MLISKKREAKQDFTRTKRKLSSSSSSHLISSFISSHLNDVYVYNVFVRDFFVSSPCSVVCRTALPACVRPSFVRSFVRSFFLHGLGNAGRYIPLHSAWYGPSPATATAPLDLARSVRSVCVCHSVCVCVCVWNGSHQSPVTPSSRSPVKRTIAV